MESRTQAESSLNYPKSIAKAAKQNFFKSDNVKFAVGEASGNKENTSNSAATERYARKTFHTVRAGDPRTASSGNLGAPSPQIMSRARSRKNDQSFETHGGIIGLTGSA